MREDSPQTIILKLHRLNDAIEKERFIVLILRSEMR